MLFLLALLAQAVAGTLYCVTSDGVDCCLDNWRMKRAGGIMNWYTLL